MWSGSVLLCHVFLFVVYFVFFDFFFFKQKTSYEMRISDWSSDVCSSDLAKVTLFFGTLAWLLLFIFTPVGEARETVLESLNENIAEIAGLWIFLEIGRASCRERVCKYV